MLFSDSIKKRCMLVGFFALLLLFGFGSLLWTKRLDAPTQIACTLEAKLCLDGSAVVRTGPNCEFAACPTATPSTND